MCNGLGSCKEFRKIRIQNFKWRVRNEERKEKKVEVRFENYVKEFVFYSENNGEFLKDSKLKNVY